ncbi:MAG TPA: permease prefix domain 1-containing protein [Thermomicrobiales bacterium]|jgi:uncharacterized membrane protein|nr:permease prefix domain 1-containing protein [Thermomicrobiales bacterium]
MSTLTDRYVAAAACGVPERQRLDVELELRASIADEIDARIESGESPVAAERAVLTAMGDPARLAATYSERPQYLIGPEYFLEYQRLLVTLLAVIVPILVAIAVVLSIGENDGFGGVFGDGITAGIFGGIQVVFWTTLVFVILERSNATQGRPLMPWSLDTLPNVDQRQMAVGQTIPSLVMLALFAIAIVWQEVAPFVPGTGDERVPVLNPDLWSFWLPVLLVLLLAEAVFEVAKYRVGRWTAPLAMVNTVLNVAFAVPFAVLAWQGDLVNPRFLLGLDWPEGAESGSPLGMAIAVGIAAVATWDVVDGWMNSIRSSQRSHGERLVPVL